MWTHQRKDSEHLLESEKNPCPSPFCFPEHAASAQTENVCLQNAQNSGLQPVQCVQSFSESVYASLGFELERKPCSKVHIDFPSQQQTDRTKMENICTALSTPLQCNNWSGFASHELPKTSQNCHCASPELASCNYLPTDSSVHLSGSVQDRNKCSADRNSTQLQTEATGGQQSDAKSGHCAYNSARPSAPTTYLHNCTKPDQPSNGRKRRSRRGQKTSGKSAHCVGLQQRNKGPLLIKQISTDSNAGNSNKPNTATRSYSNPASLNNPPNYNCSNSHVTSSPALPFKETQTLKFHGWTPLQMETDSTSAITTIPLRLYRRHFRHRPIYRSVGKSLAPGLVGFFVVCTYIDKHKIEFSRVFISSGTSVPILGAQLLSHLCPTLQTSPLTSPAKHSFKERGEKMGRTPNVPFWKLDCHLPSLEKAPWKRATHMPNRPTGPYDSRAI